MTRSRDDLYDALDRLPRPVKLSDGRIFFSIDSADGDERVSTSFSSEEVIMREYFTSLPAAEKVIA